VATHQFFISKKRPSIFSTPLAQYKITSTAQKISIQSKNLELTIDKNTGSITDLLLQKVAVLTEPILPNFWRAPTDNDYGNFMPKETAIWKRVICR